MACPGRGAHAHRGDLAGVVELGILDAFLEHGFAAEGGEFFTASGEKIAALAAPPRLARPDVPPVGAIMRPVLASILADATRASATHVRLGVTFTEIVDGDDGATVTFTDGTIAPYDLVIGADGINSSVRKAIFPGAPSPRYTGQSVWRAVLPRPLEVETLKMWIGDRVKVGVNPVSRDEMYMMLTEERPTNTRVDPAQSLALLKALLVQFSAPLVKVISDLLDNDSRIVVRPIETILMPRPWWKGHVVLIGDTVHATTPPPWRRRLHRDRGCARARAGTGAAGHAGPTPSIPSSLAGGNGAGWWSKTRCAWAKLKLPTATAPNMRRFGRSPR